MFALILTLAVNTAPAPAVKAPIDGTYTYGATLNGATVGKTTIVVARDGSATTISEDGSGSVQGIAASAKTTLTLGADLSPNAYVSSVTAGAQATKSSVAFDGDTATLTGASNQSFKLTPDEKHFVVLDGALLAGFIALPAEMVAWGNPPVLLLAPIYAQSAPLTVDPNGKPARPSGVPAADVSLSISAPVAFNEWYDPVTMIVDEIDVPSQNIVVTRTH